ncbi:MAG: transketolase family protein [Actinobacteria bacterium]|nr:transketolase family protein [Actinomycetota bacterium]
MELREVFGKELVEIGKKFEKVIVLDADLKTSIKTDYFEEVFPKRFFQLGIAEQNMIGMAAGLSTLGLVPFACSFATFVTKRVYDQLSISIAYPNLNVKIAGCYAGIMVGKAGATHQSIEDIALMRVMPNMKVITACDQYELRSILNEAASIKGPVYLRILKPKVSDIFDSSYKFKWGKTVKIADGKDITIFSSGYTTHIAIAASKILMNENIFPELIHVPSIKPLDDNEVIDSVKKTGCAISIEDHSIFGGLGGLVAEILSQNYPVKLKIMGLNDEFSEAAPDYELFKRHGISEEDLVQNCKKVIKGK